MPKNAFTPEQASNKLSCTRVPVRLLFLSSAAYRTSNRLPFLASRYRLTSQADSPV